MVQHIEKLPALPVRPSDGHKGTFGRVVIVAGSRGMSGAACLCGYGALRSGAGLVTLAVPDCIAAIVASVEPCWMTLPLSDDGKNLAPSASLQLDDFLRGQSVVAVGPGLGQAEAVGNCVRRCYANCERPMVVDADGLNAFARCREKLLVGSRCGSRILTPHPGEFARLSGLDLQTIQNNRVDVAIEFSKKWGVVLVLKGANTVVSDGTQVAINSTGNSGMGTGGSGDVLTGIIAGLMAQDMEPFDAAQLGAHLHGLAGDVAAQQLTERSLIASDIHAFVSVAWKQLEKGA